MAIKSLKHTKNENSVALRKNCYDNKHEKTVCLTVVLQTANKTEILKRRLWDSSKMAEY